MCCKVLQAAKKPLIWLLLLIIPLVGFGHSPSQSSTLLVEGENGQWTLQIRGALTAFEYLVHQEFSEDAYNSPKEFSALVAEVAVNNLSLYVNGKTIALNRPKVKLGHETILLFKIENIDDISSVALTNTLFKNIFRSKSAFLIFKNGVRRTMLNLEKDNDFSAHLKIQDSSWVLVKQKQQTASFLSDDFLASIFSIIVFSGALVMAIVWFVIEGFKRKNLVTS